MLDSDTIAAPITPPGHGPVAIVRISGPKTREILPRLLSRSAECLNRPREAIFSRLLDPAGETLDDVLALFFPAPGSFTGEDCAEIQLHGSPYLVQRLLQMLTAMGCRLARPGEFSERAFHNGKLDLVQAEAIADLIASETEAQARLAREQLAGKLSDAVSNLGEPLRDLLAEVEAQIDFPEEELDGLRLEDWSKKLDSSRAEIGRFLASFRAGRLSREGISVVLLGIANAGKSSLLNRLAGEDRAIVTDIPGTTRDTIEEHLSIDGYLVRLCDTAGLEADSSREIGLVERLGVERSWRSAESADLALFVLDPTAELHRQKRLLSEVRGRVSSVLPVINKADLAAAQSARELLAKEARPAIETSALTGVGLSELRGAIRTVIERAQGRFGSSALIASERHFAALSEADTGLLEAASALRSGQAPEFVAFEIRQALAALEDIIGVTTTEDVLGRIFSRFCIGK